jgi:acyl-CoA synthetase (AMP-forming)/AMP-acid ligase II
VKAIVVPRPGAKVSVEELSRFAAEVLAHYKVPSKWELRLAPLPRNASGKVMKWLLAPGTESPLVHED